MEKIKDFFQSDLINEYIANGGDTGHGIGGVCVRLSFKFAALSLAGELFQYEKINFQKTLDKFNEVANDYEKRYEAIEEELQEFDPGIEENLESIYALQQATMRDHVSKWADSYSYKKGNEKVEYTLSVGEPFDGSLSSYLKNHSIPEGEAVLISFSALSRDKKNTSGHTMAIIGGTPPYFFDPEDGLYELNTKSIGRDIKNYINRHYQTAEDFEVVPLSNARKKALSSPDNREEKEAVFSKLDAQILEPELKEREIYFKHCLQVDAGANRTYAGAPIYHNPVTNDLYLLRQHSITSLDIVRITGKQHGQSVEDMAQRVKMAKYRRLQGLADTIAVHTKQLKKNEKQSASFRKK